MTIETINPATGKEIKAYPETPQPVLLDILSESDAAFRSWKGVVIANRAKKMKKAAERLRNKSEEYAQLITAEMGKPIVQARKEIEKCAWLCDYYAENAEKFLRPEEVKTDASRSYVAFEPLGIILAIMPWNFPFWQAFRAAVPAVMAGNTMVLKHASNVSGCALAIESVFHEAEFPEPVFRTLILPNSRVAAVIEHPLVRGVTITGSVPAGRKVATKAGEMLKKTVLELGGSDPYLILEDADLEDTVKTCVTSRLINSGQSCIAAKRFIVTEKNRSRFEDLFVAEMKKQKMGDPLNEATAVGPLARKDLRDELHAQVQQSIAAGAKLLLGGKVPEQEGAFYPPTVLTDVAKGMPAYGEELFGPVASIIPVKDENQAILVANDTCFGLGAAVFTRDAARGEKIAKEKLEAGACFVNAFVKSDPRLPFGGIRDSGYGRELGIFGIREFVNIKTVYVK